MAKEVLGVLCKFEGYCPRDPGKGCLELGCLWAEPLCPVDTKDKPIRIDESGWVSFPPNVHEPSPHIDEIINEYNALESIDDDPSGEYRVDQLEDQLAVYMAELSELREYLEFNLEQVKLDLDKAEKLGKTLVDFRLKRLRDSFGAR